MRIFLMTCLLCLVIAPPAMAHNIKVSAYVQDGTVFVQGLYADKRPVQQGRVAVHAGDDRLLLQGETNQDGRFSFPIPEVTKLKITVSDRLGHRTRVSLRESVVAAGQAGKKD